MARKRRHGEGSIVKLKNGTHQVRVSYWEGGKLKRLARYTRTSAEATRVLADLRRQLQTAGPPGAVRPRAGHGVGAMTGAAGAVPEPGRMTLGQFAPLFLEAVRDQVRPRTHERYASLIRIHIVPHLARVRLRDLRPGQVQGWVTLLTQSGLSARSVEQAHAVLRRMLALAERWGFREGNPARLVSPPRPRRPEVQPFTPAELAAVLATLDGSDPALAALVLTAAGTGLRQGELLGLRWRDVDLAAGRFAVRGQLQWVGSRFVLVEPKSQRGRRTLFLPQSVVAALRGQRRRWEGWTALPT